MAPDSKKERQVFTLNPEQVAAEAIKRGVHPVYRDRIRDMAAHGWITHGTVNGDHKVSPYVSIRVAKGWPLRGSITLKRKDGSTVKLRLVRKAWKLEVTK